jgi:hypothetical protein
LYEPAGATKLGTGRFSKNCRTHVASVFLSARLLPTAEINRLNS